MSNDFEDAAYDESEHCKEVYAHFGLAYYASGVVESGIANVLLFGEFLLGWKRRIEREGKEAFDRMVYEAEFDAYLADQFAQSLGNLVRRMETVVGIPPELKATIAEGKKLRDFLAHHYFRERASDFMHRRGRDRMIAELTDIRERFREMDRQIEALLAPIKNNLGIPQGMLDRYTTEALKKARAGQAID
jgi:hypothetical protein